MEHLKKLISWSNIKVPHPIFNMNSADHCPAKAKGLCTLEDECYARKAERLYPSVLPFRNRQEEYWDNCLATQFVREFREACEAKKIHPRYLRISESGDFKSQDDVDKLSIIAMMLSWLDVRVYVYTARQDLDYSERSHNLIVTGSNFMVDNMFVVVNDADTMAKFARKHLKQKAVKCIADCSKCTWCAQPAGMTIFADKH